MPLAPTMDTAGSWIISIHPGNSYAKLSSDLAAGWLSRSSLSRCYKYSFVLVNEYA